MIDIKQVYNYMMSDKELSERYKSIPNAYVRIGDEEYSIKPCLSKEPEDEEMSRIYNECFIWKGNTFVDIPMIRRTAIIREGEWCYGGANWVTISEEPEIRIIVGSMAIRDSVDDFMQMLVDMKIEYIVEVANTTDMTCLIETMPVHLTEERNKLKFEKWELSLLEKDLIIDGLYRKRYMLSEGEVRHKLEAHHINNWPDYGIPSLVLSIKQLIVYILEYIRINPNKPIFMHCRGGIGRAGSMAAILYGVLSDEKIDIVTIIERLRHDRVSMVQTLDQVILADRIIGELRKDTNIMRIVDCLKN